LEIVVVLGLDRTEAADACSADCSAAGRVELAEVDTRVRDRLDARGDAVVHEVVHAPRILGRNVLAYVEVADRAAEADGKRGHIEPRDRSDAALPAQDCFPRGLERAAHWRNDA